MARRPFFSGNYGSSLGSFDTAAKLIAQAGQTQGQAMANIGKQIGDTIEEYQLNKVKRKKLEGEIEAYYEQNPEELTNIGMSGDEEKDKKDFLQREKFKKGNMSMAELEGLAGKLARGDTQKARKQLFETNKIANQQAALNVKLGEELFETKVGMAQNQKEFSDLLLKLKSATTPKQIKILNAQAAELLKRLQTVAPLQREADIFKLEEEPDQIKRDIERDKIDLDQLRTAKDISDSFLEQFGGPEGKAKFDYQGVKLSRKNVRKELEKLEAQTGLLNFQQIIANTPPDKIKDFATTQAFMDKLDSSLVLDPNTKKQITFKEYRDNNVGEPKLYPLTGPNAGPAGILYGNFITAQKQAQDILSTMQVQADDATGTGAPTVPTAQNQSVDIGRLTPPQAIQALQERIGQIRRELPQLSAQEQQLGQPGQMTTLAFDTTPFGNINTPLAARPQTISDVQNSNIPQRRLDLMAELEQLEAKRRELESKFGVR